MTPPRTPEDRRADTERLLAAPEADAWVASASADGVPHLVPLSLAWDGRRCVVAAPATALTTRNIVGQGRARLGLGGTRDVVMVDAVLERAVPVHEAEPTLLDAYAAQAGWDPRAGTDAYVVLVLAPTRIQAWRDVDELADRTLMRDGQWLAPAGGSPTPSAPTPMPPSPPAVAPGADPDPRPSPTLVTFALAVLEQATRSVLADGGPLVPFVVMETNGTQAVTQFGPHDDGPARGRAAIAATASVDRAAVAWNDYLVIDGEQAEAVVVEASEAGAPRSVMFAQRYGATDVFHRRVGALGSPALIRQRAPLF